MVVQTLTVRQVEVGPVEEAIFAVSPLNLLLVAQRLPARTTSVLAEVDMAAEIVDQAIRRRGHLSGAVVVAVAGAAHALCLAQEAVVVERIAVAALGMGKAAEQLPVQNVVSR